MIQPDFNTYSDLRGKYSRTPVYREINGDLLTPVILLSLFAGEENLFLLESAGSDRIRGRYTFFGYKPRQVLTYSHGVMKVRNRNGARQDVAIDPTVYLDAVFNGYSAPPAGAMGGFAGGFVGYMSYGFANYTGTLRNPVREAGDEPVMMLMEADEFFVFDNYTGRVYACVCPEGRDLPEEYEYAVERTLEMARCLSALDLPAVNRSEILEKEMDFGDEEFMDAVRMVREDINRGECIQVVLSNRYVIPGYVNPVSLYRMMRNVNPSPYMFYIRGENAVVCGTSPETHLRVSGGKAILKPIAGTAKTGENMEEITARLLSDEKERAEHLMLVDLARNDLYTCCQHDTVRVTRFFEAERYSHVVHIVSEVEGMLMDGCSSFDLFRSSFPAGTVSGAPRVRAMELIDSYEPSPRGFYAGCAGYFSYNGDMDTCIIIRSARITPGSVILRAGAGIVHDSTPCGELAEIGNKLGVLLDSLGGLSILEGKDVSSCR